MSSKSDLNAVVTVRMPRWVAYELSEAAWDKAKAIKRARERLTGTKRPRTDMALHTGAGALVQAMEAIASALYNAE